MGIQTPEWKDRVAHWIRTLKKDLYRPLGKIRWEAFQTMEELTLEEVKKRKFEPVSAGTAWGHTWEYGWFHTVLTLPAEAAGKRIALDLKPDGEATLFVNDRAFGTYRADWVEVPHHYVEDNCLTRQAAGGEVYDIYMEVYAGHHFPTYEVQEVRRATGPLMEGDYEDPLCEGARRIVGTATYGIWNEDAYQLYMDAMTLQSLLDTLDETELRAAKIAEALEQFTLEVDFEQDPKGRDEDYRRARKVLRPALEAKNGSTMPCFYAVGNAHIDLAWLWPFAETYRKTARTFAAQLRLLEEYPEYRYIQSQPAAYEMCREHYPELFERILQAIRDGRWIADGAMWVEPDTNMSGGEALIRQLLYGKKYFKEVLGTDSEVLWLPDTFGYTGALPQILQGCGVKYLITQKIFWSYNGGEQFPYHYFYWEGMDGSRITTFLPTSYTYKTNPAEARNTWKNRSQKRDLEGFFYPFGYGDGGGGPCRDHVEYVRRCENLEGSVRMQMASPREFFRQMEQEGGPKHTWVGELYFSAHRGTYTTQARIKKDNRRAEEMLHDLELFSVFASWKGMPYPAGKLEEMWKVVLLHQFHDILPGTAIARVYEEAASAFDALFEKGRGLGRDLFSVLAQEEGYSVWNPLGFARKAVLTLPEEFARGVLVNGVPTAVTAGKNGPEAVVTLPPYGAVSLLAAEVDGAAPRASVTECEDGYVMENRFLRAVLDRQGRICSFRLKEDGCVREFVAAPMNQLRLYRDIPRRYDAWDIDSNYVQQEISDAVTDVFSEVMQAEGSRAAVMVSGRIGRSSYRQEIILDAEGRRLEFRTTVDWKEQHRLLKAAFPVQVYAENGINEMQFGYVERPTHRSRAYDQERYEVCNHRYSALCDESHGAAVLNDCKYGISMNGNALELTLLRAAVVPDRHADIGIHTFTYAFTAWNGPFCACDAVCQGYELNSTPVLVKGGCRPFSAVRTDAPNVMVESVKLAEDGSGDLILRLYECAKAQTETVLHVDAETFGQTAVEASDCTMLEEETKKLEMTQGGIRLSFRPFEIRTVRVRLEKEDRADALFA